MTRYNNNRFTPGNKSNLRLLINAEFIRQYYRANSDDISQSTLCTCIPQQANNIKQGYNDSSQTKNFRISQAITGNLGGRTTFGNLYKPVTLNYLGGWEGQPGGSPRPLRNIF